MTPEKLFHELLGLGLKALWNTAKAAKSAATAAFRSAKSNGKAVARACVNVLKPRLGDSWTAAWQNAGFTGGSIAIPDNPLTLLQQLRAYFAANPTHEQADLGNGFAATAAACEAAAQAISDASDASNQSNTDAGSAKAAYEAGIAAGRARLTGLRTELEQKIGDADPRWYAFGFERPSDPETPEMPENLVATDLGQGFAALDWDDARRAESYRVRAVRVATGEEVRMVLVQDSEVTLPDLPMNEVLRIEVSAYNQAGESQAVMTTVTLV